VTCNFLTVLYVRSFHIIYFTLTAAATVISAKILKRVIKQARPVPINRKQAKKKSYGMPSSHSAAICFLTTYLQCLISNAGALTWQNIIVLLFFHGFSLAVVWSRVRLGHHTKSQVIAGSLFGLSCALVAYSLWHFYFSKLDIDDHVDESVSYLFSLKTR
jgi:dolichyldiphosphatase